MQNFLLRAKLFAGANKTFVAVVVLGVLFLLMLGGGFQLKEIGRQVSFNTMQTLDMDGAYVRSGGTAAGGASYGYDSYAGEASYSKAAPSFVPAPPRYGTPAATPDLPADKKVIQNGSLELLVKSADSASAEIRRIAESNGGSTQNSSIYEYSEGIKSGSVTVRVPSANFNAVMDAVKKIAVKVNKENVSSDDVTAEYVDLEAQVKNYQAEEKQYQDIMARAVKIDEILNVASKLAEVRNRIERTQGQLNYLSRQVAMSTLSISLTAEPEVKVFGIVWRPLTVIKQAFRQLLQELTGFVDWLIKFILMLPVYLLKLAVWVLIIWVIWRIVVWLKRKFFPPKVI